MVNFIDAERQWFKAETGLGVRETPLETSICSHVILEDQFVEIEDTLQDDRMRDNPLCNGNPGLRFYAGALLQTAEGLPLGTLCVLDYQPRTLTPLQREAVQVLARQVMAQLSMRKALRANKLLRQEIDHRVTNSLQSLSSFVRIQQARISGSEARKALASVNSRIEAIARLHKMLCHSDAATVVDLSSYLAELTQNFEAIAPDNVALSLDTVELHVTAGQAVAVGTLVNEFVANSIKYAFPDGQHGTIFVTLAPGDAPGTARLTCRDTGVGLNELSAAEEGGLGMFIAQVVSAELQTELEINSSDEGLILSLAFEIDRPSTPTPD